MNDIRTAADTIEYGIEQRDEAVEKATVTGPDPVKVVAQAIMRAAHGDDYEAPPAVMETAIRYARAVVADLHAVALLTSASQQPIFAEVAAERRLQDDRWGEQNHPDGTGPNVPVAGFIGRMHEHRDAARRHCQAEAVKGTVTWLDIAREEAYEAWAEDDPAKLRTELIQSAAVFLAWVEAIDRRAAKTEARP